MSLSFIVDDDFRVCEARSDLLASHNLESVTFQAAAEYLRFVNPNVPSCLVLDLSLPDITGLELQNTLSPTHHPPIAFISSDGDIPSSVRAMKAGAIDFLTKPVNDEQLLQAINAALIRDRESRHIELNSRNSRSGTPHFRLANVKWCHWCQRIAEQTRCGGVGHSRNYAPDSSQQGYAEDEGSFYPGFGAHGGKTEYTTRSAQRKNNIRT